MSRRGPCRMAGGVLLVALYACGARPEGEEVALRIAKTEQELAPLLQEEALEVSDEATHLVQSLLRDYATYINAHHGDSLSLHFGMRRADLLLGKGDAVAAIQQWIDVVGGGANGELAAEAMFRVGLTREVALQDTVGALKAYAELIRLHPESQWSGPAGEAAKWLTFSESEFIRALELGAEAHR